MPDLAKRVPAAAAAVPFAEVARGETWAFDAQGWWVDWYIPSGPEGYDNWVALKLGITPRYPRFPFFCLLGAVGDEVFAIGKACTHQMVSTGMLQVFVNDAPGFYWNNWGHVTLTGRRTGS